MYDGCFKYVDLHNYIKSKCFMLQIWLHLSMHSHNADNINIFRRDHKNIWDQSVSLDNYEIYFSTLPLRTGYSIISATDSVTPILSYHCRVDILMLDSPRLQPDCLLVHSMHRVFIILVRYFIFERQSVKYVIDSGCEDVLVSSRENIYVFRDIISMTESNMFISTIILHFVIILSGEGSEKAAMTMLVFNTIISWHQDEIISSKSV